MTTCIHSCIFLMSRLIDSALPQISTAERPEAKTSMQPGAGTHRGRKGAGQEHIKADNIESVHME